MSEQEVFDFFPPLHPSPGKMLTDSFLSFWGAYKERSQGLEQREKLLKFTHQEVADCDGPH